MWPVQFELGKETGSQLSIKHRLIAAHALEAQKIRCPCKRNETAEFSASGITTATIHHDQPHGARGGRCAPCPRPLPTAPCRARSVGDLFRYRRTVGDVLAVEGLRQALRQRKATPAAIARVAQAVGVCATMRPFVMALISDA